MPEELILVALRVLSCFAGVPHKEPDPADVQRLHEAVYGLRRSWNTRELATYIIERERKRLRAKGEAAG